MRKSSSNRQSLLSNPKALSYFYGTVHAEATLMGLIASLFLEDHEKDKSNATEITYEGRKIRLEQAIISLLGIANPAIAVGKMCCWCCQKLSQLINPLISTPGSHGTIYPWCPPRIGISLEVLEVLEGQLWGRLCQALHEHSHQRQSTHSRQSSGPSTISSSDERIPRLYSTLRTF